MGLPVFYRPNIFFFLFRLPLSRWFRERTSPLSPIKKGDFYYIATMTDPASRHRIRPFTDGWVEPGCRWPEAWPFPSSLLFPPNNQRRSVPKSLKIISE